ncbi:39S ribosomal protein L30, mitochondrial [Anthophora retusa]
MANRFANVLLTFVRGHRQYSKAWLKDAVRYEYVKYHPRVKSHVDPPITPSKVLMVRRVKPFKGNPYWEKDILEELGFAKTPNDPVFVKNTPEVCAMLWKVKHLVKISPVQLPENIPEVDEYTELYVDDFGKIHVTGKLDRVRYETTLADHNCMKRLRQETLKEKLRLLWMKGNLVGCN